MLDYILLGALQGILEWFPLSSEGMVALAAGAIGVSQNPVDLALFLHVGTLLAVLFYFREDWLRVLILKDMNLLRFLTIATVASLPIGYLLYGMVRDAAVGSSLLLLTGLGLLATSFLHRKKGKFSIGFKELPLLAGAMQGLAVIPGLSRGGSTVFALSLGRLEPKDMLKLSYMMSVPAVAASTGYLLLKQPAVGEALSGAVAAFVVGVISLGALMKIAEKLDFAKFTLGFGLLCILGWLVSFL